MVVWRLWIPCVVALIAIKDGSALDIRECSSGIESVTEDSNVSLTCGHYNNRIQWYFVRDFHQRNYISECHGSTCYPTVNNQFSIQAQTTSWGVFTSWYESRLGIRNIRRQQAFFVYCYDTTSEQIASCKLQVTDSPYRVKLNHNCPEYVFEGSNVSCTCSASRTASPSALLVWEGMNNATLLLENVSRRLNQNQFTCRLKWGPDGFIKENVSYKLAVAYGPSDAMITSNEKKTDDESETILLTCTATDVYPSAVFQWNVTCFTQTDSENSSTCSLNFTQKFESLAILCTARNTYYHQAYASNVYVLISLGRQQGPNAGLIGGVTTAILLVLIIVLVSIVYIIKGRNGILDRERGFLGIFSGACKCFHPGPAISQSYAVVNKPQIQTQTPIKRQAAPSGDIYTVTNTTGLGHVVDDYAVVCKTANDTGATESTDTHQATTEPQEIRELTILLKPTTIPETTITNKTNVQDLHGTDYMNVTEVPTDSGLGVYHVVPWATMSGSTEPDTREYSVPTISEEEYNELHFEEDRTGQEDQADNYHHLQIT